MTAPIELLGHLAYKLANAVVNPFPFPHIYVENVFPSDFFAELRSNLPPPEDYASGKANYNGRVFNDTKALTMLEPLRTETFRHIATAPFGKQFAKRFPLLPHTTDDLRLVLDSENYSIGPHTDAPHKILSFLFYLPAYDYMTDLGTSVYLPKDPTFRCEGGPHYPFDDFVRVHTAPFRPNTLFAFFKTNFSFHGVEPIKIPCRRDVLLWNLYGPNKPGP